MLALPRGFRMRLVRRIKIPRREPGILFDGHLTVI